LLNERKASVIVLMTAITNNTSITKEVDGGGDQDSTRFDSTYVLVSRLNESYDTTTTMKNNDGFEKAQLKKKLILLERIIRRECRLSSHHMQQKIDFLSVVVCALLILFEL
jgi:hypothetical protein